MNTQSTLYVFIFLLWLTCHNSNLFSQSQQNKSVNYLNGWSAQYGYLREGNHETLHGMYRLNNDLGGPLLKGKYQNGKKEGLWEYHHLTSGTIAVEAKYSSGQPSGIWEYYNEDSQTWMIYNFDLNEVIILKMESRPVPVNYSYAWPDKPNVECIPDRTPIPLGPYDPYTYLNMEINLLKDTMQKYHLNDIAIQFIVDEYGKVDQYSVNHSDADVKAQVQEILTGYRYLWLPAKKDDFLADIKVELRPNH
jgi:antitoxin component YwqK of YwqJK toxin-antitoxin module